MLNSIPTFLETELQIKMAKCSNCWRYGVNEYKLVLQLCLRPVITRDLSSEHAALQMFPQTQQSYTDEGNKGKDLKD